jgi:hypothetical protein
MLVHLVIAACAHHSCCYPLYVVIALVAARWKERHVVAEYNPGVAAFYDATVGINILKPA